MKCEGWMGKQYCTVQCAGILLLSSARRFTNKKSIGEALTQEHANEMADGIASILGEEMQGLEKRQHSGLVWFSLMRW